MKVLRLNNEKGANKIGVLASSLCLLHCIATPLIFVTQLCTETCCSDAPAYWRWIDYTFLVVSFIAVYQSTKMSSNNLVRIGLWLSWLALFLVLINEKFHFFSVPNETIYFPALALIVLHTYNSKFCKCEAAKCCVD
jgi:hypothetical protein